MALLSDGQINSVLQGICVFEASLVLCCHSEQLPHVPHQSVDIYFSLVASGCAVLPSLRALLLLLAVGVIVGAILFQVVKRGLNKATLIEGET